MDVQCIVIEVRKQKTDVVGKTEVSLNLVHCTRCLVVTDSSSSFNAEFLLLLVVQYLHVDLIIHSPLFPFQKRSEHIFKENNTVTDIYAEIGNTFWLKTEKYIFKQNKICMKAVMLKVTNCESEHSPCIVSTTSSSFNAGFTHHLFCM